MNIKFLDNIYDTCSKCHSVLIKLPILEYLEIISKTYENRGGLDNQRGPLKTPTAKIIRERMITDLEKGTVLPPIVVGVLMEEELSPNDDFNNIERIRQILEEIPKERLSIIDGMQRTTALYAAEDFLKNKDIRIDLWLTNRIQSLTYRMLVLNTGQIPWDIRRQVEVIYDPLITEIQQIITTKYSDLVEYFNIIKKDDKERRKSSGDYHASDIVELYLAFSLKTAKVDIKNELADAFLKLDMMKAMSSENFLNYFIDVFAMLAKIDLGFGKYSNINSSKFLNGKDFFKSQPAKIGFITAAAHKIYGITGIDTTEEKQKSSHEKLIIKCNLLIDHLKELPQEEVNNFLKFDILEEKLSLISKGKIGDQERELYLNAFKVFFSEDFYIDENTVTLEPLWRAN